ncbi:MAG: bacterial transcriptional activator domain-containing protein, partial [Gammaproteobacteria bacterium]
HQAVEHARSALAMAIEAGAPFVEAHCRIDLARALLGRGDDTEWAKHLRAARTIGRAMGSPVLEYHCLETEAQAAFQRGQGGKGINRLAQALALGRGMGGATWLLAGPRVSARLYDRALAAGIEVDHVQRLIRRRRLTAPDPTLAADHWPWPVKVYTLGRFDLIIDDAHLRVADKGQKKPLERGIEADELVEAFYQRLIRCYQHLGRTAEARATGERCRRVLAAALGTPPSAETLALIRTLGL